MCKLFLMSDMFHNDVSARINLVLGGKYHIDRTRNKYIVQCNKFKRAEIAKQLEDNKSAFKDLMESFVIQHGEYQNPTLIILNQPKQIYKQC